MKLIVTILTTLVVGASSVASAMEPVTVQDLAWLTGCWASAGRETGSGEQWTIPAGGTLFGISRTVKNSETVAYEFIQIRETEAGKLEYIARPSGQVGATFVMVSLSGSEVVFENPGHDFPQRIIYRLKSAEKLEARIEGEMRGEFKAVDFPLTRIACD